MPKVIDININSPEYRMWLKRRNEKNLVRRTQKKLHKKRKLDQIRIENQKKNENHMSWSFDRTFCAPKNFSLLNNFDETADFFKDIVNYINKKENFGNRIFIDIEKVSEISVDALMYLLAVINNLNKRFRDKYEISGNTPENDEVKKLLEISGFFKFVNYRDKFNLRKSGDNLQIVSGNDSNPNMAKHITDFVMSKANISNPRHCSFVYSMMIELTSNSQKHAYSNSILIPNWYCFVQYDGFDKISFIFMDTGEGIPSTVRQNFWEKVNLLGLKKQHNLVESALNGEFRSSTGLPYRNKGLPKIREFCKCGIIENMRIITNKADVLVKQNCYVSEELKTSIIGTLYCWEFYISKMKGAK